MVQTENDNLRLKSTEAENFKEYKYLSQTGSFADRTNKELKIKILNIWKSF